MGPFKRSEVFLLMNGSGWVNYSGFLIKKDDFLYLSLGSLVVLVTLINGTKYPTLATSGKRGSLWLTVSVFSP